MSLPLSSQNVIQYLQAVGMCSLEDGKLEVLNLPVNRKNYNLVVDVAGNHKLLVKQEHGTENEGIIHELFNEWLFHQLLQKFPVLGNISAIAPLVVHFDEENSILVRNYFSEYLDYIIKTAIFFLQTSRLLLGRR
jgi:hypothetical protein